MAINKQTIISAYDEKLTLLQWLKLVNKALNDAVLTNVEIEQRGNATFVFVFTFEDGTKLESNEIIVNQGESVNGAFIRNGHLYLTLTNGDELDAGNVKPVTSFAINENQHLIVNYGDGTSQDLGAIFSGNVNIDGTLNATKVTGNEIVENMSGYSYIPKTGNFSFSHQYVSVVKNGNKITFVVACVFTPTNSFSGYISIGDFTIPASIGNKLYSTPIDGLNYVLDIRHAKMYSGISSYIDVSYRMDKISNTNIRVLLDAQNVVANTNYTFRYELTFLLSDSLAV